jgi:hypothetical protein
MTSIDSGYDTATILEVLIKTLVQKNVISEQEAKLHNTSGKGRYLPTRPNRIRADWTKIRA